MCAEHGVIPLWFIHTKDIVMGFPKHPVISLVPLFFDHGVAKQAAIGL